MTSTHTSQYSDLSDFLIKHSSNNNKHDSSGNKKAITHTRIASAELKIYGGAYNILPDELPLFRSLYYDHVFVKKRKEYLTEKQLDFAGPILVDFDFRYDLQVTSRQHTHDHIADMIELYLEKLKNLLVFEDNKRFPIFIMEKPHINRDTTKGITKDGVHMIIGIHMEHVLQVMLREQIVAEIGDIWDLPLTNTWEDVFDKGITTGSTNWPVFGSQKPKCDAYKVTRFVTVEYNSADDDWVTVAHDPNGIDFSKDLHLLSAQYDGHVKFEMNEQIKEEFNKRSNEKPKAKKAKGKLNVIFEEEHAGDIQLSDIVNPEILAKAVDHIMSSLKTTELLLSRRPSVPALNSTSLMKSLINK